ncbi:MAG: hypothetical protein IPK35_13910 [Saprospiraceae bacterium]|nr:hypothetical protein [Saprospiraceae bacterium]
MKFTYIIRDSFVLLLYFNTFVCSQPSNIGHPPVFNFAKKDTKAGTQTWAIAEDNLGNTWFGNNAGLIKFDGYRWEIFPLPVNTLVRSLTCDTINQRVYVGSQGEFGYFGFAENGKFLYKSLSQSLPSSHRLFGEVWHTINTKYGIFFRTDHQVFRFFNGSIRPLFDEYVSLNFIAEWGSEIVLQDSDNKLYYFDGERFQIRTTNNSFNKGKISSVINLNNQTTIITTLHNGIFQEIKNGFIPWHTSNDQFLKKNVIYCATGLDDEKIALGTSYEGVIILNKNREIENHINKSIQLQNNTVLSIFNTNSGNIWAGLDNGIDLVQRDSYFRIFYPDDDLQGTGYTAEIFENELYLGTNTGLYKIPWQTFYSHGQNNKFKYIENSKGQVWKLQKIGKRLWMAHHEGAFTIAGKVAQKVKGTTGVWKFIEKGENEIIAGFYEGLIQLKYQNNLWQAKNIEGFEESSRFLINDKDDNIWVSHPYRGIYKILKEELQLQKTKAFKLNSNYSNGIKINNFIFPIDKSIVVSSADNLYKLNPNSYHIKKYSEVQDHIDVQKGLKFLEEDSYKNIWYATTEETGILVPQRQFNTKYQKYIVNELNNRLPETFQSILTIDKYNAIIPTERGFLHFNPEGYMNGTKPLNLYVSKIVLKSHLDSTIYCKTNPNVLQPEDIILTHDQNKIEINLSVSNHPNKQLVEYCYKINDGEFSLWQKNPDIGFNQLSSGKYVIEIKAKNQGGVESNVLKLNFVIKPPWFRSKMAFIMYGGLLLLFWYLLARKQKKKFFAEKKSIIEESQIREQEHLVAVQESQEEIIRLQNEKLQAEIAFKNQELTSYTYHLVSKNELISEIKKAIQKLGPKFENDKELKREFKTIMQLTDQNAGIDADWDNFVKSFDQVHSEFFKRLTEKYNNLSSNDYKMCTYLRLNLTTKEIATLMNISIRSVETNRYRLRKKLGLHPEANLTQYLLRY